MRKFVVVILIIVVGLLLWGVSKWKIPGVENKQEKKNSETDKLDIGFYFGHIGDGLPNKVYLEIPLYSASDEFHEQQEAMKKFNDSLNLILSEKEKDEFFIQIEPERIKPLIKIKEGEKFEVYSSRGYEGIFTAKRVTLHQSSPEGFYPCIELDREIQGVKDSSPVIAKVTDKKFATAKRCKSMTERKPRDYKEKEIWAVLREKIEIEKIKFGWPKELPDHYRAKDENFLEKEVPKMKKSYREWDIEVLEGNIDTDKELEIIVSATWEGKAPSFYVSGVFILDSKGRTTQVVDIIPMTYSSGDARTYWKMAFGIDIDKDGFMEFIICNYPYTGYYVSIYKWDKGAYREIYESYYFGGW